MSHLKVHLRIHFKKHEKLEKTVKKNIHLTLQLMVHLKMQSRVLLWISNLTLYTSFMSYIEQNKQNC